MSAKKFIGLKCIIECVYWYNKDLDHNFDFNVGGKKYPEMDDWDIYRNWDSLMKKTFEFPAAIIFNTPFYEDAISDSNELFSRHNKILTRRYKDQSRFKYLCCPEDDNVGEVFAVIMSDSTREEWSSLESCSAIKCYYGSMSNKFLSDELHDTNFNLLLKDVSWFGLIDYLEAEYKEGSLQNGVSWIPDAHFDDGPVVPESIDEASGKYRNIYALLQNKGKIADRYERLIAGLDSIDADLASKLNFVLEPEPDEEHTKIVDAIQQARENKITNRNPLAEALRRMGGS